MRKTFDQCTLCVYYVPADRLTGREYMALIVSLNCIVAVTKMASVADSDFPLERKSLTCMTTQTKNVLVGQ